MMVVIKEMPGEALIRMTVHGQLALLRSAMRTIR